MTELTQSESDEAAEYLAKRRIPELFQYLTAALVFKKPNTPLDFLIDCVEKMKKMGDDNIFWDTFIKDENPEPPLEVQSLEDDKEEDNESKRVISGGEPQDNPEKKLPVSELPGLKIIDNASDGQKTETVQIKLEVTEPEKTQNERKKSKKKKQLDKLIISDVETDTNTTPAVTPTEPPTAGTTGFMLSMDAGVMNDIQSDGEADDSSDTLDPYSMEVMKVLKGDINNPPLMPSNVVRIFLSSTFTDFKAERNILPQRAYPELRQYCSKNGLDFQVADMRWGVTQDMVDDHQVTDLCLMEIENCQKLSVGPAFVTLIGNRYGFQPFPHHIESKEFSIIKEEAIKLCPDNVDLLDEWFKECHNRIPSVFILQPITSRLKHYNNQDEDKAEDRRNHISMWQNTFKKLRTVLRKSSQSAFEKNLLDETSKRKYFLSVTENEIERGLLEVDNPEERSLCYVRELKGLKENIDFATAARFIDIDPEVKAPDNISLKQRTNLATQRIPLKLQGKNLREYKIAWENCSLEYCDHEDHEKYLKEFCENFISDLKMLINKKLRNEEESKSHPAIYLEALHHVKFANLKSEIFFGRDEELQKIREFIFRKGQSNPFILRAGSGHGKTALLAHVCRLLPIWSENSSIVLIQRFLGTSASSSSIFSTLKSIVEQICVVFKVMTPAEEDLQTMSGLRWEFQKLIAFIKKKRSSSKLVIILDSIDQLNPSHGAHTMAWLPKVFPKNVKVVISVLNENEELMTNIERRLPSSEIVDLESLPKSVASEIINAYLMKRKRKLTDEQHDLILKAFERCKQPLFLKLTLDSAIEWYSYDPINLLKVSKTAIEAIKHLFDGLERKNGKLLVSKSMGYVTCGRQGLSPVEVEDALSCDDEVLNDVYRYHDPPLDDVIRIPSLLWSRIQHELKEYLAERMTDGKTVMAWYHRQFFQTAHNRYVKDFEVELHSKLAEIYSATNGIRRTIQLEWRNKKTLKDADRQISHQPTNVNNIRKLNSLPYHLLKSQQFEKLKSECLLNFEFIFTKLKCQPLIDICRNFEAFLGQKKDDEVNYTKDFLQLSYGALLLDPTCFPHEVLKRLYTVSNDCSTIADLVSHCMNYMEMTTTPILVPVYPITGQGPESPLKFSRLIGSIGKTTKDFQTLVAIRSEITSTVTQMTIVNSNREQVGTIDLLKQTPFITTNNSRYLIYAELNKLKMYELDTGDIYKITKYCDPTSQDRKITIRCLTITQDDSKIIMGVRTFEENKGKKSGSYTSRIFVIDLVNDKILHDIKFKARKHIEKAILMKKEKWLLTISHDMIYLYDLDSMEILYDKQMTDLNGLLFNINYSNDSHIIGALGGHKKHAKILIFDCETKDFIKSEVVQPELNNEENNIAQPIAVDYNQDASEILIVYQFKTVENKPSYICKWDRKNDVYSKELLKCLVKFPTSLITVKNFTYCLIGFQHGSIIILTVNKLEHLKKFKAHNHTISSLSWFGDNSILSMGNDQYMKIWDIDNLLKSSNKKENENSKENELESTEDIQSDFNDTEDVTTFKPEEEETLKVSKGEDLAGNEEEDTKVEDVKKSLVIKEKFISRSQDYFKICVYENQFASLLSSFPAGVRFWNFNGLIDHDLSFSFTETYQKSLESNPTIRFSKKPGGNILIHGKYIILNHFIRDCQVFYISFYDRETNKWKITAHNILPDSYFNIIYRGKIYIMRECILEIYSIPDFELIKSVEIHSLKKDLPTFESSGSKRKLSFYKIGITEDERYFIVSVPLGQSKKYFDLVDIETGNYKRHTYTMGISYKSFDSGTHYLCHYRDSEVFDTISIGLMKSRLGKTDYCSRIYSGMFQCPSNKYSVFANKNNKLILYDAETYSKVISLKGHAREVTNCIFFQNSEKIITYSIDNTVRIWNVANGKQLCSFNSAGSVEDVNLTDDEKKIILSSFNGPMKKKAIVLDIKNIL